MIKGMTGYGSAAFSAGDIKGVVEVKSVNHRYLDLAYYLPVGFSSIEGKVKQLVAKDLSRGRVTAAIKLTQKSTQKLCVNHQIVRQYLKESAVLQKKFKVQDNLTVSEIMRLPGVVETEEVFVQADKLWPVMEKSFKQAIKALMVMRKREGMALKRDVADKIKGMGQKIKIIESRSSQVLAAKKKIVTKEEFSSFQRSIDINEELSRLKHYLTEVRGLLTGAQPVGKKIDFIAQEMQRETNTIGSKIQDNIVSNAVIALKSKIEKIREQAQNIE